MAQATDQDIPAELKDGFDAALGIFTWKDKPFVIKERHPFRIPTLQGCRTIRPPIPRGSQVSDAMCAWRHVFGDCIKCWNRQPATDGAEPDGLGPYGRDWWFTEAIGKLPWYFNYFMMETGDAYSAGEAPLWCKTICDFSAWSKRPFTGLVRCNHPDFVVRNDALGDHQAWCATSIKDPQRLHVYFANVAPAAIPFLPFTIRCWEVPDTWICNDVPDGDDARNHRYLSSIIIEDLSYGWRTFPTGGAKVVALTMETDEGNVLFRGKPFGESKFGPAFS